MQRPLGAETTADEVLAEHDCAGMRVMVTGVSAGLGVETARAFAARGAEVIGAARDIAKAERACEPVREAAAAGGGSLTLLPLDLADLASVANAAARLREAEEPIDIVIANAGVMATPLKRTADGHELQFGTNVLGHYALLATTAPMIRDGGRIVTLSSAGHRYADVDLQDPDFRSTDYDPWIAYGRSKTGDALLAVAFDVALRGRGIRAASVHPGGIQTELDRHLPDGGLQARLAIINEKHARAGEPPFRLKTVPQGAATSVWAATASGDEVGGRYCEDSRVAPVVDAAPSMEAIAAGVRAYALDPARAEALIHLCADMTGVALDA